MSTRLILCRHGRPIPSGLALSEEGKAIQQEMADRLKGEGITCDHIYTSPLDRAVETAQILAETLGGTPIKESALNMPFEPDVLVQRIAKGKTTILVGHDPTLAGFANELLGTRLLAAGMVKSGALILEFSGPIAFGAATLIKYLQPASS